MIALAITGAGSWLAVAILAAIDYSNIVVAIIAAIASVSNTLLIAKYNRGQRELREGQAAIAQSQLDVKRKVGAHHRATDGPPPPPPPPLQS